MHFTGEVYRHPMEANTQLLEVTIGCSHNKCSFCTMYQKTPFRISKLDHIEEDLQELASYNYPINRIYLVNADPFVLSTDKLITIGKLINKYLPFVETITCYVSIKNLQKKSLEDLIQLKELGYNDLHIGLESAYTDALMLMNKGYDEEEALKQILKVKEAGLRWDALIMLGVAGKGNGEINTNKLVDFLNKTKPYMVSIMPTSVSPGSKLEEYANNKTYVELTEEEMLIEEINLIKGLEIEDCYIFGSHNFNLVPVSGPLSKKDLIIKHLEDALNTIDKNILKSTKPRGNI